MSKLQQIFSFSCHNCFCLLCVCSINTTSAVIRACIFRKTEGISFSYEVIYLESTVTVICKRSVCTKYLQRFNWIITGAIYFVATDSKEILPYFYNLLLVYDLFPQHNIIKSKWSSSCCFTILHV